MRHELQNKKFGELTSIISDIIIVIDFDILYSLSDFPLTIWEDESPSSDIAHELLYVNYRLWARLSIYDHKWTA